MDGLVFLFLSVALIFGGVIFVVKRGNKERVYHIEGLKRIENYLNSQGFHISRYVGKFDDGYNTSSFYLYVDDKNKKWLMASPVNHTMELVIRDYSEMLDYGFFDIDSDDWLDNVHEKGMNATRGALKVGAGILVGASIGGIAGGLSSFGGGRGLMWGATLGGLGGAIAHHATNAPSDRPSGAYGIAIKTPATIAQDGALIFDFLKLGDKIRSYRKLARGTSSFKVHMAVLSEMAGVCDYIINWRNENEKNFN